MLTGDARPPASELPWSCSAKVGFPSLSSNSENGGCAAANCFSTFSLSRSKYAASLVDHPDKAVSCLLHRPNPENTGTGT